VIFAQHVHGLFGLGALGKEVKPRKSQNTNGDLARWLSSKPFVAVGRRNQYCATCGARSVRACGCARFRRAAFRPALPATCSSPRAARLFAQLAGCTCTVGMRGGEVRGLGVDFGETARHCASPAPIDARRCASARSGWAKTRRRPCAAPQRSQHHGLVDQRTTSTELNRRRSRHRATGDRRHKRESEIATARGCCGLAERAAIGGIDRCAPSADRLMPIASGQVNCCLAAS